LRRKRRGTANFAAATAARVQRDLAFGLWFYVKTALPLRAGRKIVRFLQFDGEYSHAASQKQLSNNDQTILMIHNSNRLRD
jgi:hypothetical protein